MKFIKSLVLLFFLGAVILFTFQNLETVRLSFISWHMELPLAFVSAILYILGALSGGLLFSMIKSLTIQNKNK